jgi:hypothetical protein
LLFSSSLPRLHDKGAVLAGILGNLSRRHLDGAAYDLDACALVVIARRPEGDTEEKY